MAWGKGVCAHAPLIAGGARRDINDVRSDQHYVFRAGLVSDLRQITRTAGLGQTNHGRKGNPCRKTQSGPPITWSVERPTREAFVAGVSPIGNSKQNVDKLRGKDVFRELRGRWHQTCSQFAMIDLVFCMLALVAGGVSLEVFCAAAAPPVAEAPSTATDSECGNPS